MTDYRPKILEEFEKMRRQEYAQGERFKVRAYVKAMEAIRQIPGPINNIRQVTGVRNIGKKSLQKIQEIITTGSLQVAQRAATDSRVASINLLSTIHGIGIVKARELVLQHNINTIEELEHSPVRQQLTDVQKLGLHYHRDITQRIPRTEMDLHNALLQEEITKIPDCHGCIAGSYRRGLPDSGDIDLLITENNGNIAAFHRLLENLWQSGYLVAKLAQGENKFNGICRLPDKIHRRIDILFSTPEEAPYSLLYFTGSKYFNTEMRKKALEQGLSLNEKCLIDVASEQPIKNENIRKEQDIFRFLSLKWVEPHDRSSGVLEPASSNKILVKIRKM